MVDLRLIAAPFTPFTGEGELNLSVIEDYAAYLHASGVVGVFVCGTTGEGLSLTQAERRQVAEAWLSACRGRLEVIVHIGHPALGEALDLARHAEKHGAQGIASIGPIFFAPSRPQEVVAMGRAIAGAAPHTPFYYYHMPLMSRVTFPASSIFSQLAESIPNFRGVKFTHEDLADYQKCLALAGDSYEVFFGRDELLLSGLQLGARAAVGSTYNLWAPLYQEIGQAFQSGRLAEAEALQNRCTSAIEALARRGGLPAFKACLALAGIDCGPVRLPIDTVGEEFGTTRERAFTLTSPPRKTLFRWTVHAPSHFRWTFLRSRRFFTSVCL